MYLGANNLQLYKMLCKKTSSKTRLYLTLRHATFVFILLLTWTFTLWAVEIAADEDSSGSGRAISGRVTGGNFSTLGRFPWVVAIHNRTRSGQWEHVCGGSYIGTKYVVTAAHCLDKRNILSVLLGANDIREERLERSERILVRDWTIMPGYVTGTHRNDLGFVRLDKEPRSNPNIKKIGLVPKRTDKTGSTCVASGWGSTSSQGPSSPVLKTMDVKILKDFDCRIRSQEKFPGMSCYQNPPSGLCPGDSGAGVACRNRASDPYLLYAVHSSGGNPCGDRQQYTTGCSIGYEAFNDFIKGNLPYGSKTLDGAEESQGVQTRSRGPKPSSARGKAKIQDSLAATICGSMKKYSTTSQIVGLLNAPSQLAGNIEGSCQVLKWSTCSECDKFKFAPCSK